MTAADWIGALVTIVTAGLGAWVAALVALGQWRAEMTGRRRAELAEEVLTDFYRYRTEMRSFASRASAVEGPQQLNRLLRELYPVLSELEARRHRFAAVFGIEAAEPFEELRRVSTKMIITADEVAREGPFGGDFDASLYAQLDSATARMEPTCRAAIAAEEARHRWPWQR